MNDRELATLTMMSNTVDFSKGKTDDFTDLPTFNDEVLNLEVCVKGIRAQNKILEVSTEGFTKAKNTAKDAMLETTTELLKIAQAFASISENEVMQNEVRYSDTDLTRLQEGLIGDTCTDIIGVCKKYSAELLPYGLVPAKVTKAEANVADYKLKLVGTPQYKGVQKAAKDAIAQYFATADDILKRKLDKLIELIKKSNTPTYIEFKNARKIRYTPKRTLSLKGKVIDAATGQPMSGVTITITKVNSTEMKQSSGADLVKSVKRTAKGGGFQSKSESSGGYIVTASKPGFVDKTINVFINDSEMSVVNLTLDRV
jgi:hypothetical protein